LTSWLTARLDTIEPEPPCRRKRGCGRGEKKLDRRFKFLVDSAFALSGRRRFFEN